MMGNVMHAAVATDEERIAAALKKLPPEYIRKVCIFSEELVKIFDKKLAERWCAS